MKTPSGSDDPLVEWPSDPVRRARLQGVFEGIDRRIGTPTHDEIGQMTADAPAAVAGVVHRAFGELWSAKRGHPEECTPWRDLLEALECGMNATHEIEVIGFDGNQPKQMAFIDGGDSYMGGWIELRKMGIRPGVINAVIRVHRALELLGSPADQFISQAVTSEIQSRNAKRARQKIARNGVEPASRDKKLVEMGQWLRQNGYQAAVRKSDLIDRAIARFDSNETDVREAAKRAGLTRKYKKSAA